MLAQLNVEEARKKEAQMMAQFRCVPFFVCLVYSLANDFCQGK